MSAALKHVSKRILIVEDEPAIQKYYEKVLGNSGYETFVCSNGKEAMDVLPMFNPEIIIVDLVMPVSNGVDLLKVLAKKEKLLERTRIISGGLFSLAQEEKDYLEALGIPIRLKPVGPRDLLELVKRPNQLLKIL